MRDLLDPDGTADDTSDAVVYGVSVARGMELSAAADYAEDPAVYAAAVNRETIGSTTTPDTSTGPRQWAALPAWFSLLVLIMAVVVGTAARKRPF